MAGKLPFFSKGTGKMNQTKNDIPLAKRKKAIDLLAPLLSDSSDLWLQCKQAHWNVKGASFIALHELFDKVEADVEEYVDMIAERIVQLGGEAEGTVRSAAKHSRLKEYPLLAADGSKHVAALSSAIASFTALARPAIDDSDDAGDAITADMLTEIVRGLDKWLWFVESHNVK